MTFNEVLSQTITMLHEHGRVSYRALMRQFALDEAYLADLKDALLYAYPQVVDDGRGLVWSGDAPTSPALQPPAPPPAQAITPPAPSPPPEAERRQLTVLFCDLVDSTALSSQLDPEDLREVVQAYQETCAKVIARFEGHIAQYLGDGLLVYFGYPLAHEDDAQRAVRAGLGIVEALGPLNTRLTQERGVQLAVRLGIHTGLVVVGEVGGSTRQEQLALGETPNLAARLQGLAAPNTLVISAATLQLLGGFFACQSLGTPPLKGLAQSLVVYQVLYEHMVRSRLEAAGRVGLTPLVGREQEAGLLLARWAQVKDGVGQVVLLSGEAGIGKSRLVQVLTEHVATEPQAWLTLCQCSPYHQHSALYPLIELLERVALRFDREESQHQKLRKLEGFLVQYGLPLAQAVPLFAALLSLPLSADYVPLAVSPEQHKQQTLHALLLILLRIAAQQPVLFVMEDLHWVDPTTLEFLSLLVDQGPTARILALWTFRPDFTPLWTGRSHLTQIMVHRLPRRQAVEVSHHIAHGKGLPAEVVEQIVAKTDGVPLFVEELTKMLLESGLLQEQEDRYALTGPLPPLAIPATLHDSLMARLDRLATVKGLAQLAATLGREFAYELLHAVAPRDKETLPQGLHQLVAAEFLYQQGVPPQATYTFKHALIQEAAYQSLLKSTRQQYHRQIAQVLETQFPETAETQPELLAHHYTAAGLGAQAIPYWQRAGQRAVERSAHAEALRHLTTGLELLTTLPETLARAQQELDIQLALGPVWMATKGNAAPEVAQAYTRARALCHQVGETPRLFPVLFGLWRVYFVRAEVQAARDVGEQLLALAQRQRDPALRLEAHRALGTTLYFPGALRAACDHLEQGLALYHPHEHRAHAVRYGRDPGMDCHIYRAWVLWTLGYLDQARAAMRQALALVEGLAHPVSQATTWFAAAYLAQMCRHVPDVRAQADALITLATEQGFPQWLAAGTFFQGWTLAAQGQAEAGIAQLRQGLAAWRGTGAEIGRPRWLTMLAEAYGRGGQTEAGRTVLAEALALVSTTGQRIYEADLHRLQGELVVLHAGADGGAEAEPCFQRALDVARHQEAKALELRAAMSLSRLWQQQGKRQEAHALLAPVYNWFTEGFDTADLQDAKALLHELEDGR